MPDPGGEKLHGWAAHKGGQTIRLTLHEAKDGRPAAGYFDVLSGCRKYGTAQQEKLSKYTAGTSYDKYDPLPGTPRPIPTGFPSPAV